MKKLPHIIIILLTILCNGCITDYSKTRIDSLLKKDHAYSLVEAFYLIGENKDSSYLRKIFENFNP